ncbi:hypothetical protein BpHYR1_054473 [Brachionus plicatilis]|uniref:Uncharacterized protein n=1 Tax=Brachionus plicatilis TaxID=10195 RepID=A0A3M7P7U9_BRAPC|nr:hypothetical protein BpHYR1_054473 [Brachionus plicatilis]
MVDTAMYWSNCITGHQSIDVSKLFRPKFNLLHWNSSVLESKSMRSIKYCLSMPCSSIWSIFLKFLSISNSMEQKSLVNLYTRVSINK